MHWAQDKSDEQGLYLLKTYQPALAGAPAIPADTSRYVTGWNLNPAFANLVGISPGSKPGLDNSNDGVDLRADIDLGGATRRYAAEARIVRINGHILHSRQSGSSRRCCH